MVERSRPVGSKLAIASGGDLPPPRAQGICGRRHTSQPGCWLRWGRSTDADGDGDVRAASANYLLHRPLDKTFTIDGNRAAGHRYPGLVTVPGGTSPVVCRSPTTVHKS